MKHLSLFAYLFKICLQFFYISSYIIKSDFVKYEMT